MRLFADLFGRRRRKNTMPCRLVAAESLEVRRVLSALQVLDADAGVTVSESPDANRETFRVRLDVQPTQAAVYSISNPADSQAVISPASVTFTSSNWNEPQTITVVSLDDNYLEGTRNETVTLAIDVNNSEAQFHNEEPTPIALTLIDHEDTIEIYNGNADVDFSFRALSGNGFEVSIDGETKAFTADNLQLRADLGAGMNTATLTGDSGYNFGSLSPGSGVFYGDNFRAAVANASAIRFESGGGADDIMNIYDSALDDEFQGSQGMSRLVVPDGRILEAVDFPRVIARSRQGKDTARFSDTPEKDTFIGKPDYAYLANPSFRSLARGFTRVVATSNFGGHDVAGLYDSDGNDHIEIAAGVTEFSGPAFSHQINGFRAINAYSTAGSDSAILHDTLGNDLFVSSKNYAYLSAAEHYGFVSGFHNVTSTSTAGEDKARFQRYGDDFLDARNNQAMRFQPFGFQHSATDYQTIENVGFDESFDSPPTYDRNLISIGRRFRETGRLPNDYRFRYAHDLMDFNVLPDTVAQGNSIASQLPGYFASHSLGAFMEKAGYHELIAPEGELEVSQAANSQGIETLTLTDRFGLESRVLRLAPSGVPRAKVVLMHGSYSLPEYVTGQLSLSGPEYHRNAALDWVAAGYEVYVPEMQGTTFEPIDALHYSALGTETARMVDLLTAIDDDSLPVVVAALSRGATVSEVVAAVSPRVDVLISSGGSLRYSPDHGQVFATSAVFDFLQDRTVIISLSNLDTYNWTYPEAVEHSISMQSDFADAGGRLETRFFIGAHEFWTAGEIAALDDVFET